MNNKNINNNIIFIEYSQQEYLIHHNYHIIIKIINKNNRNIQYMLH